MRGDTVHVKFQIFKNNKSHNETQINRQFFSHKVDKPFEIRIDLSFASAVLDSPYCKLMKNMKHFSISWFGEKENFGQDLLCDISFFS